MPTGKKYPIFVSWSGQKMGPNMVTTQLNQYWKKDTDKDLHCRVIHPTLIRKMTTTAVHEKEPTQNVQLLPS